MPSTTANGITIEYDTFGDPNNPALLLVMGLGAQMIAWDEFFCMDLSDRGFHVIRFDNRDTGLSQKIEGGPAPDFAAAQKGDFSSASYDLGDMAADAVGLLDALGIEKAHVAGASLGGMIVQMIAINHPERVLSMTSIMSTTGNPNVGQATEEARAILMSPPAADREGAMDRALLGRKTFGSKKYPIFESKVRAEAGRAYDRCFYPAGVARQMVAAMKTGDRTERLKQVKLPALVIHGTDDTLIAPSGGEATAQAIPGAEYVLIEGMGHDLPQEVWPQIFDAIQRVAAKANAGVS